MTQISTFNQFIYFSKLNFEIYLRFCFLFFVFWIL
jgi:hypothetical protein